VPRFEGTRGGTLPDGRAVYYPILLVRVEHAGSFVDVQAVVDSGADFTMVPAEIAEVVGLPFEGLAEGGKGLSAGGAMEHRPAPGRILFDKKIVADGFLVAEPGKLPVVLLGRDDFFRLYTVRFAWHRDPPTFDLDPATEPRAR